MVDGRISAVAKGAVAVSKQHRDPSTLRKRDIRLRVSVQVGHGDRISDAPAIVVRPWREGAVPIAEKDGHDAKTHHDDVRLRVRVQIGDREKRGWSLWICRGEVGPLAKRPVAVAEENRDGGLTQGQHVQDPVLVHVTDEDTERPRPRCVFPVRLEGPGPVAQEDGDDARSLVCRDEIQSAVPVEVAYRSVPGAERRFELRRRSERLARSSARGEFDQRNGKEQSGG